MKASLILKVVLGLILAIISSTVTSSLLAQAGFKARTRVKSTVSEVQTISNTPRAIFVDSTHNSQNQLVGRRSPQLSSKTDNVVDSKFSLKGIQVDGSNGVIKVLVNTEIQDKRTGRVYMWRFHIMNTSTNNIVFERNYESQVFFNQSNEKTLQEFKESIAMPNGNYKAYVNLYDLPIGISMDVLRNPKFAENYVALRAVRPVTVIGN